MEIKKIIFATVLLGSMVACVPLKQFSDVKSKNGALEQSNQQLKDNVRQLTVENNELDGQILNLQRKLADMEERSKKLSKNSSELEYENQRLTTAQKELEKQIAILKEGSSDEISKLLSELQIYQNNLQEREDRVRKAEELLAQQQEQLKLAQAALAEKEQKLREAEAIQAEQQARLMELQDALDKQKQAVADLRNKLNNALMGFYDQGLSVYEKNGKVYVSLEENLLFKTGSYNLDPNGQEALKSLSGVLAGNPQINIMVEGHTDDVPLSGSGQIKDNWDLSVMRATAVTKIILQNAQIDPKRITAAGRGEYFPLDEAKTPEARRKNRRTEIILTPNLSEVFDIIQAN
ncbi:MAG: OmpA family protein [Prolixibacteraceae bacterium]|nr:OmpA family protein [Prolixibacteraceae bacterium]